MRVQDGLWPRRCWPMPAVSQRNASRQLEANMQRLPHRQIFSSSWATMHVRQRSLRSIKDRPGAVPWRHRRRPCTHLGSQLCVDCNDVPCLTCRHAQDPMIAPGWDLALRSGPENVDAAKNTSQFKSLFKCPGGVETCKGGQNRSSCVKNDTGALCSACKPGFYKEQHACIQCGSIDTNYKWQLLLYGLAFLLR